MLFLHNAGMRAIRSLLKSDKPSSLAKAIIEVEN
jgi:hypothetical protein